MTKHTPMALSTGNGKAVDKRKVRDSASKIEDYLREFDSRGGREYYQSLSEEVREELSRSNKSLIKALYFNG